MSGGRGGRLLPLALLCVCAAVGPVAAHDAPVVEDEFLKGAFAPSFVPPAPGTYELPVLGTVPALALRDADGRTISTASLMRGKVGIVSFVYTACADRLGCPLASAALRRVQERVRAEGLEGHVMLLTISFDVARDTPAQLARYARAHDADPAMWRFLAAPSPRVLDAMLRAYGQDRTPEYDAHGRFTGRYRHVLKVFLVDTAGRLRNVYSTGFLVPELIVNDVRTVLRPARRD